MSKKLPLTAFSIPIAIFCALFWISCKPDTEAPVIRLKGGDTISSPLRQPVDDPGVVAFDKEDLDLVDQVVISGNVDIDSVGIYSRTYTVTDAAGNSAQVSRTVVVEFSFASLVGTYHSSNAFGSCSGIGTTEVTIDNLQSQILKFSPAVGYFPATNNVLYMHYYDNPTPQLNAVSGVLPCSYTYTSGSTGIGNLMDGGKTIHVFMRVYSQSGSYDYFTADYVRAD